MMTNLLPALGGAKFKTIFVLMIALSTYSTFDARTIQGDDVPSALLYALATSAFNSFVWIAAFLVFPHLRDNKTVLSLATAVLFFCCVFTVAMSGLQNQISFSSEEAFQLEAKSTAADHERALENALANRLALQDLLPMLQNQGVLYKKRRDSEFNEGAYTGAPGPGDVVRALGRISETFMGLSTRVQQDLKQVVPLDAEAKTVVRQMRDVARSQGNHEQRMTRLMQASDRFGIIFNRMNGKGEIIAVKFALDNMGGELDLIRKPSRNARVAARQKAAIKRIRDELTASLKSLEPFIQPLLDTGKVEAPRATPMNAQDVVLRHWDSFIPQWLIAMGIDLWPGLALAMGMMLVITKDPQERAGQDIGDMPHRLVIRVADYVQESEEARRNRQSRLPMRDAARGYSDDDDRKWDALRHREDGGSREEP